MPRAREVTRHVVLAACLVAAVGIVAVRRLPRWLSDARAFGDGRATWSDVRAAGVRHAVWDAPRAFGGELGEGLGRIARSGDGRWLVFAAGSDEAGWDLWCAELGAEGPQSARPLAGADGAADELAPAFEGDWLWFASDRAGGAGGLDLWRAPFAEGRLGQPEPVVALNTSFDELDPAPGVDAEGQRVALFASDRGPDGGLALYEARLDAPAADVRALDALDAPGAEREPCLSDDGASLYYVREGRGGGTLWRSFRDGDGWHAPHVPEGLADLGDARSPALSRDGFSLAFTRDGVAWASASRELVPLPLEDLGWKDLALVAALLLTALLAWLAGRWNELDVLYKCLLASILLHLLALWLMRDVHPETESAPRGPEQGPTFRVRVLQDSSLAARLQARGGELVLERSEAALSAQPQRAETTAEPARAAAPAATELVARASELAGAPGAREATPERSAAAGPERAPDLAAPRERFERLAAAAPSAPRAEAATLSPAERSAPAEAGAPSRADVGGVVVAAAAPGATPQFTRPESGAAAAPAARASSSERAALADTDVPSPGVAAPRETFESLDAPAPALARPEAQGFEAAHEVAAASRQADTSALAAATPQAPQVRSAPGAPLPQRSAPLAAATPRAEAPAWERAATSAPGAVALSAPRETFEPLARAEPSGAAPPRRPEAASFAPARSARPEAAGPARLDAPRASTPEPAERAPLVAVEARPRAEPDEPRAPERLFDTPYRTRFGAEKATALREHGGGAETEAAVAKGLAYLASVQNRDGSWGRVRARHEKYGQVAVGKTGLCLLAFLGAGHTPGVGEHGAVAERAVDFLLSVQDEASGHFGDGLAYSHGIATYALAECFALTRDERLRAPLERAVARILAAQTELGPDELRGGWGYFDADGPAFDRWPRASITAWQVMALESARLGGLRVPDEAFDAARGFLIGSWDGRMGAFRYSHDPSRLRSGYATLPGSTPAAMFALALLGEDLAGPDYAPARGFVSERAPRGYRWRGSDAFVERADANLYFWYYGTLATFRIGGDTWERWNLALKESLLPTQQEDGSWEAIDLYARDYAGDREGDLSYSTALCVLSLEVYYRYFTPLLRVK